MKNMWAFLWLFLATLNTFIDTILGYYIIIGIGLILWGFVYFGTWYALLILTYYLIKFFVIGLIKVITFF